VLYLFCETRDRVLIVVSQRDLAEESSLKSLHSSRTLTASAKFRQILRSTICGERQRKRLEVTKCRKCSLTVLPFACAKSFFMFTLRISSDSSSFGNAFASFRASCGVYQPAAHRQENVAMKKLLLILSLLCARWLHKKQKSLR
jgi:hypothetical protein